MSDIIVAVVVYFILLGILMYSNYNISKINERFDNSNKGE